MRGVDRLVAVAEIGVRQRGSGSRRARAANDARRIEAEMLADRVAQHARRALGIVMQMRGRVGMRPSARRGEGPSGVSLADSLNTRVDRARRSCRERRARCRECPRGEWVGSLPISLWAPHLLTVGSRRIDEAGQRAKSKKTLTVLACNPYLKRFLRGRGDTLRLNREHRVVNLQAVQATGHTA